MALCARRRSITGVADAIRASKKHRGGCMAAGCWLDELTEYRLVPVATAKLP